MLRRIFQPLVNLLLQRQFYVLLVLLAPLMFSLHWMAVRFPICFPDFVDATVYEVEPDKRAVVFESYGPLGNPRRVWLQDIEAESLTPIACPKEIGPAWPSALGKDTNGNLVFETQSGVITYVSWNARTGEVRGLNRLPNEPVMINSRYLACIGYDEHVNPKFIWIDLLEPNCPQHSAPIMETGSGIIPVDGTDSFYFVLPAEHQDWIDFGMTGLEGSEGMMGMGVAPEDEGTANDYSGERTNEDGSVEYELPPVVVNPNASTPLGALVLMTLTEAGPKEVSRWPMVENAILESFSSTGYIISQSADTCFLETHDARTGEVVASTPIPNVVLNPPPGFSTQYYPRFLGNIVHFSDNAGLDLAFDWKTGTQLMSSPPNAVSRSYWVDQHGEEYLTWKNLSEWPGVMQVRSISTNEVLQSWKPPDRYVTCSSRPDGTVHFSADGKSVLFITQDLRAVFVDKVTGKVLRHIQPRFWLPPHAALLGMATLVWLIGWIRVSDRCGVSLWIDEVVVLAVVMSFLYWRINLFGNSYDEGRVAWACVGAIAIATVTLVINQTMFRNVRLLYRLAPVTILTVVVIFGQYKWMRQANVDNTLFEAFLVALLIAGSIIVQFLFFRNRCVDRIDAKNSCRGFSLGELFGWTGLVALMLSTLKLHSMSEWVESVSWGSIVGGSIVGWIIAAVTLSAYHLTVKRCYLVLRLLGGSLIVAMIAISAAYRLDCLDLNSNLFSAMPTDFAATTCERLLVLVLGSILMALPVAMRSGKANPKVNLCRIASSGVAV